MKSTNKKRTYIIILSIVLFIVLGIYCYIVGRNNSLPFNKNIEAIEIVQEIEPHSTKVNNIDEFISNMETDKWIKIREFNLKSAPIAYLFIKPANDKIEIYSPNGEYAYCYMNKSFYKIPQRVFYYIMTQIK